MRFSLHSRFRSLHCLPAQWAAKQTPLSLLLSLTKLKARQIPPHGKSSFCPKPGDRYPLRTTSRTTRTRRTVHIHRTVLTTPATKLAKTLSAPGEDGPTQDCAVRFPADIYDLETIKKAAYRLSDRCAFEFRLEPNAIVCSLRFDHSLASDDVAALINALRNEVLEQDLRRLIAEETATIRNAVLAYAFSRTGLQGHE